MWYFHRKVYTMSGKENESEKIKNLLTKLEEEISLSYYLKPSSITLGRDLVKAMQDLTENPDNWNEN